MQKLTETTLHPFVRRVGIALGLRQSVTYKSCDHRLLLPQKGDGWLEWNNKTVPLEEHTVYIIAPGVPYRVECSPEQPLTVINFDWTMENAGQFGLQLSGAETRFRPEEMIGKVDWSEFFPEKDSFCRKCGTETEELAQKLLREFLKPGEERAKTVILSGLMMQLLSGILYPAVQSNPTVDEIYQYVCTHCTEPLKLRQVAEIFHFHPSYVNRLLRVYYGDSFRQLLIRCRLQQATLLLENTNLSAEEIAVAVGFYDGKHFAEAFRRAYGKTPTQFR